MSSGPQETRAQLLGELAQELSQLNGLSASFFRAAAARIGVTVTDMQVIESLAGTGPMTAGQLAELTGLTTGAITGMLNRLEEAGLVRRERDPGDGRKVIVQIASDAPQLREIGPVLTLVQKAWEEEASQFDDEQIAFLVKFLKRGNAIAQQQIHWLRAASASEEDIHSAPLGDLTRGELIFPTGIAKLTLRTSASIASLYQARFEAHTPDVKTVGGTVTMRYPRRLLGLVGGAGSAEVTLNTAIPWNIAIHGGASMITAELSNLKLGGFEIKGGGSMIRLELPVALERVPIQISGGASVITILRPTGVAAQVHLKGWASVFIFDDQTFSNLGNDVRLQSPDYGPNTAGYDIEVSSSASMVTITTT